VLIDRSNTYGDGFKQIFNPNGTNAGINVGSHTANPSSPADGDVLYNSTDNKFKFRENGAWVELGSGAGSNHNLLSSTHSDTVASAVSRGSIIVGNSTPAWAEVTLGTANQLLQSDGTDLGYVSISGDATLAAGVLTIANDAVTTVKIIDDAVTFAKMQNINTNIILGRNTASSGIIEEIAQVSSGEKTAGTETELRAFAPQDIHDMIDTHGAAGGGITSLNSETGSSQTFAVAQADELGISSSSNVHTFSVGANIPRLDESNVFTNATQTIGPANATVNLYLDANHTTPANGNVVANIEARDDNSADEETIYSRIQTAIENPTDASEDAEMFITLMKGGALTTYISLNQGDNDEITFNKNLDMNSNSILSVNDITPTTLNSVAIANYALATGDIFTGTHDFGGATLEIPNSASLAPSAVGEFGLDTSITSHSALLKYHDGSNEYVVPAIRTADLTTTDADIIAYDTTSGRFIMEAQSGGGGGSGFFKTVIKSSDQSKPNDTTLALDGDLQMTLQNGNYAFTLFAEYEADAVPDIKYDFGGTATFTGRRSDGAWDHLGFNSVDITTEEVVGGGGSRVFITIVGTVNVTSSGTFGFRWAQNTSSANTTTLYRGSALTVQDANTGGGGGGSGIENVVEDTSPQLGGMLDVNGQSLGDGTLELLKFIETASAVNELTITNAATTNAPSLTATGDDTNIDLTLDGKGSGVVKTLSSNLDITGNIVVSGTVDGKDIGVNGVFINQANVFGDFLQTFKDNQLKINSPDDADGVTFVNSNQTTDRNLTIPVMTANDTLALLGLANAWGTVNQNIASGGKWQEGGVSISPIGVHDVWVSATAMWPTATAGCSALTPTELATNDVNIQTLDFDTTTEEHAQFSVSFPRNWDGGTITATFHWTNAAGLTTETVVWGIAGRAYADNDALDQAFGTEVTRSDTWIAQNDEHISPESNAITLAGSPAGGQRCQFQIARKTGSDNLTGDAKLLGVMLHITTDAAVAA
jgi:hypothetical protein